MSRRSASLVQADFDRAVAALTKLGIKPAIIFDLDAGRVIVTPANDEAATAQHSNWREGAPDRV